jgi:hypothetical protein
MLALEISPKCSPAERDGRRKSKCQRRGRDCWRREITRRGSADGMAEASPKRLRVNYDRHGR